jgi:hypothetical protein
MSTLSGKIDFTDDKSRPRRDTSYPCLRIGTEDSRSPHRVDSCGNALIPRFSASVHSRCGVLRKQTHRGAGGCNRASDLFGITRLRQLSRECRGFSEIFVSCSRASGLMRDNDFTKQLPICEIHPGGPRVLKRKRLVDDRPQLVLADGAV